MHEDMKLYYSRNKLFLSQVGAWPYQSKILKVLLPCFLLIAQIISLLTQVFLLYDTWGDVDMLVEGTVNIILVTGASTKLINIVVNNSKFQSVLQLMNEHWRLFRGDHELHILRYYADIGRKVTKYYAVYIYSFVATFMFVPIMPKILDVIIPLNESRPYVYVIEAEYRVDKEKYYYPILLHSYSEILVNVGIMINVDTMYIVCVLHGCSLFSAISTRLENTFNNNKVKTDDNQVIYSKKHHHLLIEHNSFKYTEDYREMIVCLKKHQLALEYIEILESTFTYATFVLLFLNVMVMSLVGLQTLNKLGHTGEVIRFACIVLGSVSHLLCMCLPGQLLIDRSTEVFDKAYCSRWYIFSMETRSLLRILLYRSFVPCTLSAGKMFIMSMITCSSVLKTAMSYFTAFLSVQ